MLGRYRCIRRSYRAFYDPSLVSQPRIGVTLVRTLADSSILSRDSSRTNGQEQNNYPNCQHYRRDCSGCSLCHSPNTPSDAPNCEEHKEEYTSGMFKLHQPSGVGTKVCRTPVDVNYGLPGEVPCAASLIPQRVDWVQLRSLHRWPHAEH